MKKKKLTLLIVIVLFFAGIFGCGAKEAPDLPQADLYDPASYPAIEAIPDIENAKINKSQEDTLQNDPYISITYGRNNPKNTTGREMAFFTYNLVTKQIQEECSIPFDAKYATGVVSKLNSTVYYSRRSVPNNLSSPDCLCAYDIKSKKTTILETENFSYNDITMLDPETLLVMAVTARHTITPARFDLLTNEFTYTADVNNEKFELYSSGPAPLNYNYTTHKFVYMYSKQKEMYMEDYVTFETAIDNYIALISDDLTKNQDETFSISLTAASQLLWATQISEHELLVCLQELDISGPELESYDSYYLLKFSGDNTTFTRIDSPFPDGVSVSNCITLDEGKTYYCKMYNGSDGTSGLFSYCPSTGALIPILLGDNSTEGHVVNFFVVGP